MFEKKVVKVVRIGLADWDCVLECGHTRTVIQDRRPEETEFVCRQCEAKYNKENP